MHNYAVKLLSVWMLLAVFIYLFSRCIILKESEHLVVKNHPQIVGFKLAFCSSLNHLREKSS